MATPDYTDKHDIIKEKLVDHLRRNPPKLLQYYKDISAKVPAETDDKGNVRLRFDEIPIQGRESRTTLYVKNTHPDGFPIALEPKTTDPDLSIIEYPSRILPSEIARVTFVFRPKPDRIVPLNAAWDFEKTVHEL